MLGAAAAGLTVTMCNPFYTPGELLHVLHTARPAVIITTPTGLSTLKEAAKQLDDKEQARIYKECGRVFIVDVTHDDYGLYDGNPQTVTPKSGHDGWLTADWKWLLGKPGFQMDGWSPEEVAKRVCFILWSSGTSGKSKGVVLSHRAVCAGVVTQRYGQQWMGPDEVEVAFVPFFHVLGLACVALLGPAMGVSIVVLPRFELELFLRLVEAHRATYIHMAPPVAVALAKTPLLGKYDLSSLRGCSSGGAPLAADVIRTVYDRLGVMIKLGYGSSEAGGITAQYADTWEELKPLLGNTGKPTPGLVVKIVDAEGSGRTLPLGEEGEIWIKSPALMSGYLNDPESTSEALTPDGWYRSGDIGKLDKSDNLQITDRMKDMIKSSGFQCSPVEIEGVLAGHPQVADVAVGAIYSPEDATEYPRAYVVPMDRSLLEKSVKSNKPCAELVALADELNKRVETRLIKYKWLKGGILFIDQVPKNPSGKILRRLFKDCKGIEVQLYEQGKYSNSRQAKL
ncbi:acetyl-CoA synthetase-like protein [Gloeophyllum trabeum ATCC 11539]|uniref:Acetyl-CoA synthetase-like protein n=1 Tax=Gloeophyllum trabeum (strain ATCC 11539 / FP-39264 / Madison 617) TaxID=670483 RepID=S7PVV2_GLOTA|nr:acetyl-CoA synthetase-like protein [Gloeophyllum trabeum ATCC 11539]EPQ51761.1 acetyl-CoA synthetase-like protein [Gloeophyllum trabeum ATCC 11539]